jgi:hypothetical protein
MQRFWSEVLAPIALAISGGIAAAIVFGVLFVSSYGVFAKDGDALVQWYSTWEGF